MGIPILPPDVNRGNYGFSVDGNGIRYGLSAIKSVGRPVIEALVKEREDRGPFLSLKDFVERLAGTVNKRSHRELIKSGALGLPGGEPQAEDDGLRSDRGQRRPGEEEYSGRQLSLFDLAGDDVKKDFEIRMPDVDEYDKDTLLAFEKEVLGIYLSGHPLEQCRDIMEKMITAKTHGFPAGGGQWDPQSHATGRK